MNDDEEGARLTRLEENRELIAKHRQEVADVSPAPSGASLADEWNFARAIDLTKNPDATSMVRTGDMLLACIREQQAALEGLTNTLENVSDLDEMDGEEFLEASAVLDAADGLARATLAKWRLK